MTFEELLNIQAQLNGLAETPPDQVEDIEERLKIAITVEVGEALQVIKADWAWWTRHGKSFDPPNRGQLLGELADVLHFILTTYLLYPVADNKDYLEDSNLAYNSYWAEKMEPEFSAQSNLCKVSYWANSGFIRVALARFIYAVRLFGFTREELEQAYRNKAQENIMRFTQTVEAKA